MIALFGGTFNPVHYGHLAMAETAAREMGLERVIFIPCGTPPHKPAGSLAGALHRVRMLESAVSNNPLFSVSRYETGRKGLSYTYDTILHFRRLHPDKSIAYLVGADSLAELKTWKHGLELLSLCRFISGGRPGFCPEKLPAAVRRKVVFLKSPMLDISSTDIRRIIRAGGSPRYLLPDNVLDFICRKKLYVK